MLKLALFNNGSTTHDIIPHLKSMFAKFDIPEKVMTDEDPQFSFFALWTQELH